MIPRCIIWAAVSTPEQAKDEKESIPAQIEQARETIQERGWQEVVEPLVVPGQSRYINWLDQAMADIPQMKSLVGMAEAKKIDLVIVRDWDRLARTESLRVQISTRLREQGVQVYSLNQPVEPSENPERATDTALIVEGMSGILAEVENRLRVRRHRMGMIARVKKGLWPGTGEPYGYSHDKTTGILEINESQARTVRQIFDRAYEGHSALSTAKWLTQRGVPSPAGNPYWTKMSVLVVLRRPTYAGYISYGGELYEGKHEPLIERKRWEEIQARINAKARIKGRAAGSPALLSGILKCGYCRSSMAYHRKGGRIYYQCHLHRDTGYVHCRSNHHPEGRLVEAILKHLAGYVTDDAILEETQREAKERDLERLRAERHEALSQIPQMEDRKLRQFMAYERGEISLGEYAQHRDRLVRQEEELRASIHFLERRLSASNTLLHQKEIMSRILERWQDLPRSQLKQELATLFEAIHVFEDGSLEYRFSDKG